MTDAQQTKTVFTGFDVPQQNWFKLPRGWTDLTARMRSWAEQKVVEYVLRHTWGYQEYGKLKRITLDEFENGRKRRDGTRMDRGIGMRRQAIIGGIRQAVEDGFLVEQVDARDRGRTRKEYGLRMAPDGEPDEAGSQQGYDHHTPGVCESHPRSVKNTRRTEKETKERNYKKPLNGFFRQLPNLEQPQAKTEHVAQEILDALGDEHSLRFYELVAAKIPEAEIRRALAEIRADGAEHPAKLFTYKMQRYALGKAKPRAPAGRG